MITNMFNISGNLKTFDMFNRSNVPKTQSTNYLVHWRTEIVFDKIRNIKPIIGKTENITEISASIFTIQGINNRDIVNLSIWVPEDDGSRSEDPIKIEAALTDSIYSGTSYCFKTRLKFIKFYSNGEDLLKEALARYPYTTF